MSTKYLTNDCLKGIKDYKYTGGDDSLIYKYITSPTAEWLVQNVVPTWMAPNVITLIGMLFIIVSHVQYWYYSTGKGIESDPPSWVHFLAGVNILLYSLFDNMDGKQSRKTKSSSTYGMLLDHGVDCLVSIMLSMNLNAALRGQHPFSFYSVVLVAVIPLYTAVWETYQLKGMFLPVFNGPNEGLFITSACFIWTGIVGVKWWHVEQLFGYKRFELLIIFSMFIAITTIFWNVVKVVTHNSSDPIPKRLLRILPEGVIIAGLIIVERLSPSELATTHLRILLYFYLLGHAKLDLLLQISMAASQELRLFRPSVHIPIVLFTANTIAGYFMGKSPIDEVLLLRVGMVFNILMFVHFVVSITDQITKYLGIRVFVIPKIKPT